MQDVADKVGVSKATVSLVFRKAPGVGDDTRRAVMAAAGELGYRMNRTAALMTARRSHLIGVVARSATAFTPRSPRRWSRRPTARDTRSSWAR